MKDISRAISGVLIVSAVSIATLPSPSYAQSSIGSAGQGGPGSTSSMSMSSGEPPNVDMESNGAIRNGRMSGDYNSSNNSYNRNRTDSNNYSSNANSSNSNATGSDY